jgi:hypothetical protein
MATNKRQDNYLIFSLLFLLLLDPGSGINITYKDTGLHTLVEIFFSWAIFSIASMADPWLPKKEI